MDMIDATRRQLVRWEARGGIQPGRIFAAVALALPFVLGLLVGILWGVVARLARALVLLTAAIAAGWREGAALADKRREG